ncbi:hypothetical protein CRUP_013949 [Coryphaenoides rupestris]|nr:hypothetical protein CRUP_013949 [Coryphaenoides rupestris]
MPSALAVFACRPKSHAFQERHVYLDEPVKIGRSVARCRPAQSNATFDCKVLSRNHALLWFDHNTGKFYLQDTKSSNGTFINSQRLSRGSEESPPCELLSGDVIQFGVDVTENTRKVTHDCIVSTVKLFLPDGLEARRRADVIQAPLPLPVDKVAANTPSMYSQELFQLSQYLQEALHREQMLEQKLATLQRLLANTQEASESSWQALIDEDRLLSRLEVMGSQLQAYSKEDKHNYETTAKESLRRVLQEKIERSLSNSEEEGTHLKQESERSQEELQELANKYNAAVNQIRELADKIKVAEAGAEEGPSGAQPQEPTPGANRSERTDEDLQEDMEDMEEDTDTDEADEADEADEDDEDEAVKQLKEAVGTSIHKLSNFDEVIDAHLQNNQRAEDDSLASPDPLREELHRGGLDREDSEEVIHHLHRELLQAQELANTGKHRCLELQALLDEEMRSNRQQTEESSKQIQYLQSPRPARLPGGGGVPSGAREADILQAELGAVRGELEAWRGVAARYQLDVHTLQHAFSQHALLREKAERLQGECDSLQAQAAALQAECEGLRSERSTLLDRLHTVEDQLSREEVLTERLGSLENQHLLDSCNLHTLLDKANTHTHSLQREYEETQEQLVDLRSRYEQADQEKQLIHQELEHSRSALRLLQETSASPSRLQPLPSHSLLGPGPGSCSYWPSWAGSRVAGVPGCPSSR